MDESCNPPPVCSGRCGGSQGVANRDLKLENLLLDRDGSDSTRPLLKICDFGYSKVHSLTLAPLALAPPYVRCRLRIATAGRCM